MAVGIYIFIRKSIEYVDATAAFNHIIGLPRKDGIKKPFFDYEKMWYMALLEPGYLNGILHYRFR